MANQKLIITTPINASFKITGSDGNLSGQFNWGSDFGSRKTRHFTKTQMYVDSEVLRFCSSRVPFDTGALQKSGIIGTVVGSGEVNYIAPYAAAQNYNTAPTRSYDAMRGGQFFERGKIDERERILRGARNIAGGG